MRRVGGYTLSTRLASGALGDVFLGRRTNGAAGDDLAVKVIRSELFADLRFARLLMAERPSAEQFRHPVAADVKEVARVNDDAYIVMELLAGQSFGAVAQRARIDDDPLSHRLIAWVGAQVASALVVAHKTPWFSGAPAPLVHGGLAPRSLFITYTGQVRLLGVGFGRARQVVPSPAARLPYLAPEILQGRDLTPRADVYGLAIILYEAFTGRSLFRRSTAEATKAAIAQANVPRLNARNLDINPDIGDLLADMMAPRPAARPASLEEVEATLRRAADGEDARFEGALAAMMEARFREEQDAFQRQVAVAHKQSSSSAVVSGTGPVAVDSGPQPSRFRGSSVVITGDTTYSIQPSTGSAGANEWHSEAASFDRAPTPTVSASAAGNGPAPVFEAAASGASEGRSSALPAVPEAVDSILEAETVVGEQTRSSNIDNEAGPSAVGAGAAAPSNDAGLARAAVDASGLSVDVVVDASGLTSDDVGDNAELSHDVVVDESNFSGDVTVDESVLLRMGHRAVGLSGNVTIGESAVSGARPEAAGLSGDVTVDESGLAPAGRVDPGFSRDVALDGSGLSVDVIVDESGLSKLSADVEGQGAVPDESEGAASPAPEADVAGSPFGRASVSEELASEIETVPGAKTSSVVDDDEDETTTLGTRLTDLDGTEDDEDDEDETTTLGTRLTELDGTEADEDETTTLGTGLTDLDRTEDEDDPATEPRGANFEPAAPALAAALGAEVSAPLGMRTEEVPMLTAMMPVASDSATPSDLDAPSSAGSISGPDVDSDPTAASVPAIKASASPAGRPASSPAPAQNVSELPMVSDPDWESLSPFPAAPTLRIGANALPRFDEPVPESEQTRPFAPMPALPGPSTPTKPVPRPASSMPKPVLRPAAPMPAEATPSPTLAARAETPTPAPARAPSPLPLARPSSPPPLASDPSSRGSGSASNGASNSPHADAPQPADGGESHDFEAFDRTVPDGGTLAGSHPLPSIDDAVVHVAPPRTIKDDSGVEDAFVQPSPPRMRRERPISGLASDLVAWSTPTQVRSTRPAEVPPSPTTRPTEMPPSPTRPTEMPPSPMRQAEALPSPPRPTEAPSSPTTRPVAPRPTTGWGAAPLTGTLDDPLAPGVIPLTNPRPPSTRPIARPDIEVALGSPMARTRSGLSIDGPRERPRRPGEWSADIGLVLDGPPTVEEPAPASLQAQLEARRAQGGVPARVGRYHIKSALAQVRGMWVLTGWDPNLSRPVRIHLLDPHRGWDPHLNPDQRVARFKVSGRRWSSLRHSTLPTLLDGGRDKSLYFLVFESPTGKLLTELLAEPELPATRQVRSMLTDIANGLSYLHGRGLVLGHVRAASLILGDEGTRFVDLAHMGESGELGAPPRPLLAQAPENLAGAPYDHRSEQFALGALLYQLLVGQRPFEGIDDQALAASIRARQVQSPRARVPDVDVALSACCMRMLSADPDDRYPSLVDVLAALKGPRIPAQDTEPDAVRIPASSAAPASSAVPEPASRSRSVVVIEPDLAPEATEAVMRTGGVSAAAFRTWAEAERRLEGLHPSLLVVSSAAGATTPPERSSAEWRVVPTAAARLLGPALATDGLVERLAALAGRSLGVGPAQSGPPEGWPSRLARQVCLRLGLGHDTAIRVAVAMAFRQMQHRLRLSANDISDLVPVEARRLFRFRPQPGLPGPPAAQTLWAVETFFAQVQPLAGAGRRPAKVLQGLRSQVGTELDGAVMEALVAQLRELYPELDVPAALRVVPRLLLAGLSDRPELVEALEREGFDVDTAEDGHQVWSLLRAKPYRSVVVHADLEGRDGASLLKLTRNHPETRAVVFLVLCDEPSADLMQAVEAAAPAELMPLDSPLEALRVRIVRLMKSAPS